MTELTSARTADLPPRIVTVPDLPSDGFVRRASETIGCTSLDEEFEYWDFVHREERGSSFEVRTRVFEHRVYSADIRDYFLKDGFDGSVAAFIAWIMLARPDGWFASIPSLSGLFRNRADSALCAPCFLGGSVFLTEIRNPWSTSWTFVAFKRLS